MVNSQIALIFIFAIILLLATASKSSPSVSLLWDNNNYFPKLNYGRGVIGCVATLAIILLIIVLTRPEEMADYKHYVQGYNSDSILRFEPSFYWLKAISNHFGWNYFGLFTLYGILSIGLKSYSIIKMSDQIWISFLVWIATSFILMDMITIRASVASGLMLLAIKSRYDSKMIVTIAILILASLFHYSAAVLLLIIPFLSTKKDYRIFYIWIVPIGMLLQLMGITVSKIIPSIGIAAFQALYDGYSDDEAANLFNILSLGRCAIAIFLWIRLKHWKNRNTYALLAVKVYTIGCALFMLLGDLLRVGFRLAELLWCADIIAYPMLTYAFARKSKFWPILVCSVLFYITVTKTSYWAPTNPW